MSFLPDSSVPIFADQERALFLSQHASSELLATSSHSSEHSQPKVE